MDDFAVQLAAALRTIASWLATQWAAFVRGVMYDWPIGYFVLGMALVLVAGLVTIWWKGTNR